MQFTYRHPPCVMISRRSILNRRTLRIFALLVLGTGVIALLYAFAQPRVYEAECKLTFYWPRSHQAREIPLPDDLRLDRVQTVIEKIPARIPAVVARFTADERSSILGFHDKSPAEETDALVSIVKAHLAVTLDSNAMIAHVRYRHKDRTVAYMIMRLVVEDCLEKEVISRLAPIEGLLRLEVALTKALESLARDKVALSKGSPNSASADLDRIISGHQARLDLIPERIAQLRRSGPEIRIAKTPNVTGPHFDWDAIRRRFWRALGVATAAATVLGAGVFWLVNKTWISPGR